MQKRINISCYSFNKILTREKNCAARKVWPLTFFNVITWELLMVSAWNLVCGRFVNFKEGRQILTILTFGCPTYKIQILQHHTNASKVERRVFRQIISQRIKEHLDFLDIIFCDEVNFHFSGHVHKQNMHLWA